MIDELLENLIGLEVKKNSGYRVVVGFFSHFKMEF